MKRVVSLIPHNTCNCFSFPPAKLQNRTRIWEGTFSSLNMDLFVGGRGPEARGRRGAEGRGKRHSCCLCVCTESRGAKLNCRFLK